MAGPAVVGSVAVGHSAVALLVAPAAVTVSVVALAAVDAELVALVGSNAGCVDVTHDEMMLVCLSHPNTIHSHCALVRRLEDKAGRHNVYHGQQSILHWKDSTNRSIHFHMVELLDIHPSCMWNHVWHGRKTG